VSRDPLGTAEGVFDLVADACAVVTVHASPESDRYLDDLADDGIVSEGICDITQRNDGENGDFITR
jgi:hypothetical protein